MSLAIVDKLGYSVLVLSIVLHLVTYCFSPLLQDYMHINTHFISSDYSLVFFDWIEPHIVGKYMEFTYIHTWQVR
jgi:hypothetical protein